MFGVLGMIVAINHTSSTLRAVISLPVVFSSHPRYRWTDDSDLDAGRPLRPVRALQRDLFGAGKSKNPYYYIQPNTWPVVGLALKASSSLSPSLSTTIPRILPLVS